MAWTWQKSSNLPSKFSWPLRSRSSEFAASVIGRFFSAAGKQLAHQLPHLFVGFFCNSLVRQAFNPCKFWGSTVYMYRTVLLTLLQSFNLLMKVWSANGLGDRVFLSFSLLPLIIRYFQHNPPQNDFTIKAGNHIPVSGVFPTTHVQYLNACWTWRRSTHSLVVWQVPIYREQHFDSFVCCKNSELFPFPVTADYL